MGPMSREVSRRARGARYNVRGIEVRIEERT